MTVPVGREAVLTCLVHDLGTYKVAWLRVDTQTILTIQNHVITKNHRIGITYTEKRIWQLRIKDVKETDRGWYMCQINADPMKSQTGYLDVVGEKGFRGIFLFHCVLPPPLRRVRLNECNFLLLQFRPIFWTSSPART